MSGHCPINGCEAPRKDGHVMCARHWWRVPLDIRQRVWDEYRREPGSAAHIDAISDAIMSIRQEHV